MTNMEKIDIVEKLSPVLTAVGLFWEFEFDSLSEANYLVVWHPDYTEDSRDYFRLEDIATGKETPATILEEIIRTVRQDAMDEMRPW